MAHTPHLAHASRFIALVGPTAVGKSEFALHLAALLPIEIVNADSRQVYRHMDIGTSKPTPADRCRAPHLLYDIVDPDEGFSLAQYHQHANAALADVTTRCRTALLVGGSGQYVWSMAEGWRVPEVAPDAEFRRALEEFVRRVGHAALHARLTEIDPEAAASIQSTNIRRVIRALELHRATGEKPSALLRRRVATRSVLVLGLTMDRTSLLGRADMRIDTMVRQGFAEEVRTLLSLGYHADLPAMSSVGYREMIDYVSGATDLSVATARIRTQTRRLIRRQYSWFRPSDNRIVWLDASAIAVSTTAAMAEIEGFLR